MLVDFSQPVPARFEIAHNWVDANSDGKPEDVSSRSKNWIASLSRILFYTRAEDLAVFTHELFNGNVLKKSSLKEMLTFVSPKEGEVDKPLFVGYGLGVMDINPQLMRGEHACGHLGSIPGYRAFVGHITDRNVTLAVLYNSDSDEGGIPIIDGLLGVIINNTQR
jgi:hypothetical protein